MGHRRAHFDVSNTLHLIMACAAGTLALKDFSRKGILNNESVKVQLNEDGDKKKFMTVGQLYLKEEFV